MGYSLCKMADFQNRLISRIFGVFCSGFLHRTTVIFLYNRVVDVFGHFNFLPKLSILTHHWNPGQFLSPLSWVKPWSQLIKETAPNIREGYSLCNMADFEKWSHFSNIWCFFERFFPQNKSSVLIDMVFACFYKFYFLTQTDHFAKAIVFAWAIAFARWPIFKIVSFLEYLVFFAAVFSSTEQL